MAKPSVAFVVGTRPDAIKSAPAILEFQRYSDQVEVVVISTGQHREMLDQVFAAFGFRPTVDLQVMQHGQSLATITSRVLEGLDSVMSEKNPDYLLAQGDTSTTFVASLAAFYRQIPFGHIEAGLRTDSIRNPFPEEFNRRATALVAQDHFAPTRWAADNLLREGVSADHVFVTGNTGIDAVLQVASATERAWYPNLSQRIVLLTTHRRENWGEPQRQIAEAVKQLVKSFDDILVVVPMHRNPIVRETLEGILGDTERVDLIEPPDYNDFVKLMQRSHLILTDSGGVQEEAPTFGVPLLVLRETTERPEGVTRGCSKLIGTQLGQIVQEASALLSDHVAYNQMAQAVSPYGDGQSAQRIRQVVLERLGILSESVTMWT